MHLRRHIQQFTKNSLDVIDFLVDDTHKVLLKPVRKTGCTSWRKLLINNAQGNKENISAFAKRHYHNIGLGILPEYSMEEALYRLRNYYAILTVRHPMRRLESYFMKNFVMYLKKVTNLTLSSGNLVAACESRVQELISGETRDRHWRTIEGQSYPCTLNYR